MRAVANDLLPMVRPSLPAFGLAVLLLAALPGSVRAQEGELFGRPLAGHPRLLFTPEREAEVRALVETDTLLAGIVSVVRTYADAALGEPVFAYVFDGPGDPRLKAQRRAAMFRVFNLALTYRLTGEPAYAERAKQDLLAGAAFPDWASWHFLNVGEITALMAVGYDWLYDVLTEAEREAVRTAIVELGLKQGVEAYAGRHAESWWTTRMNNWNQVCNGGLVLGALAVAEDEPALATSVIEAAIASLPHAMRGYEPDGAWYEGPTYWAYGTTYNALLLDALRTALGSTLGLEATDGYADLGASGAFHVHTVGPTNLYFNFADSKTTLYFTPVLFWLAQTFDEPVYAWFERQVVSRDLPRMHAGVLMEDDTLDRFLALLVVWYDGRGEHLTYDDLPLDATFRGEAAVAAMRSGWDPEALYLGFKGGYNQSAHGHMDIGTFVLDARGRRWAMDLGGDDYDLPGYFDFSGRRWQYFRTNNRGHNTLVLGDTLQGTHARVPIEAFVSTPEQAHAVIDMSQAYRFWARSVRRGFAMLDRSRVMVQDEVVPPGFAVPVRWGMITPADVTLDGRRALLVQDGDTLGAEILEPEDARFELLSTDPGGAEADNAGTTMLAVRLVTDAAAPLVLTVLLTPRTSETASLPAPTFRPLGATGTGIAAEVAERPERFVLHGNYPNPFHAATTLRFALPEAGRVEVAVFDLTGRRVLALPARSYGAGPALDVEVDAAALPSGTYLYRLTARTASGTHTRTGRMVLVR